MKKFHYLSVALLLPALFLGACSGGPPSYGSASELAGALADRGVTCGKAVPGGEKSLVTERAACTSDDGDLNLYLFENSTDRDTWMLVGARLLPAAVGPNWAVSGQKKDVAMVASTLGAELSTP